MTSDPYRSERRALLASVTEGRGSLAPDVRMAIVDRAAGRPAASIVGGELAAFVDRVAADATAINDDDVGRLLSIGLDEEAVFEAIIAAALGASLVRLERVDALLEPGS